LVQLSTTTRRLDLTDRTVVPAAGPLRWNALDAFPRCTSLTWSGHDRGLTAALTARPTIDTLSWSAAPSTADLSRTALTDLRLSGPAINRVTLPTTLHQLTLDAAGMPDTVIAPDHGRFRLTIDSAGPELTLPHGLDRVTSLTLACDRTVSVAGL